MQIGGRREVGGRRVFPTRTELEGDGGACVSGSGGLALAHRGRDGRGTLPSTRTIRGERADGRGAILDQEHR